MRRILPSLRARVGVWISKDVSRRLLAEECESPRSTHTLVCCSQAGAQPQISSEDKGSSINNHLSGPGKSPQERRRKDHLSISSRLQEDCPRFWGLRNTQTSFYVSPSLVAIPSPIPLKGNAQTQFSEPFLCVTLFQILHPMQRLQMKLKTDLSHFAKSDSWFLGMEKTVCRAESCRLQPLESHCILFR